MDPKAGPHRRRMLARACALAFALALAGPASAVETAILTSPTPAPGAEMAYAAAVDGTSIVLGAPGENANTGAIYVGDCATLPCAAPSRIAPPDLAIGDVFGTGVGLSGDTLVATSAGSEPGAAYVYVNDGSGWTQQAKLTPSGGSTGERFGYSASISSDRIAIGADHADSNAGAIYVFVRSGSTWSQEARLTADDPIAGDAFGSSVALDGDTLIGGAPYKRMPGISTYANGAAYVFVRGATWSQQAKLLANGGANGDLFGFAVALAGDRAVIGAPYATGSQGLAFVFARSGSTWTQQTQLSAAAGAVGDEFGWTVALRNNDILVGAPFAGQETDAACGGSYLFDGVSMLETAGATIGAPIVNELAGWSIAASGARWITAAPGHIVGSDDHAGAAYWFDPTITLFHAGFDAAGACIGAGEALDVAL